MGLCLPNPIFCVCRTDLLESCRNASGQAFHRERSSCPVTNPTPFQHEWLLASGWTATVLGINAKFPLTSSYGRVFRSFNRRSTPPPVTSTCAASWGLPAHEFERLRESTDSSGWLLLAL